MAEAPIFQQFTAHSKQTLKNAFGLAVSLGHQRVSPRHILHSLAQQRGSVGAAILAQARFDSLKFKQTIKDDAVASTRLTEVTLNLSSKKLLEKSVLAASYNRHCYVGTEHLLAALLELNDEKINDFLTATSVDAETLRRQVLTALHSAAKFPDLLGAIAEPDFGEPASPAKRGERERPVLGFGREAKAAPALSLDFFATNLTDRASQKRIDPVIGREAEIERLIQILSRRTKNNPVLLGDPGVGKTAIAEGLAKQIVEGHVPEFLSDKKIYALDLSAVVAGTSFRGEFENRLRQILLEVKNDPSIILFIDELHNIIGAGSAAGSMDAANILKPALARGEIRCIGATTLEDYKKYIEPDAALERRFQPIIVNQPDVEKTVQILQGIKPGYETFHQVAIGDDAIAAAAELSERYLTDRFLPDKAIDLIDEAASAIKIKQGTDRLFLEIKKIEDTLGVLADKKADKVHRGEFSSALDYKQQAEALTEQLTALRAQRTAKQRKPLAVVTAADVAAIVAHVTGVPTATLLATEKARLLKLEQLLAKKIIGQPEALAAVAQSIRRARAGIASSNRPVGSFMFLGPSGVGKTELAKVLAATVFNNPDALVRIDMSEFAESFNISKLIGAPAGYVGYREGTKLTDLVRRRPYSVVLFDEIEKAHPHIFNLLLQILEDGHLTDATGKKINFKNTIVIMTSNIGSDQFRQQAALGFDAQTPAEHRQITHSFAAAEQQVLKQLKQQLPVEFLNRLDRIVVFQPLERQHLTAIAELQLAELVERLNAQGVTVTTTPAVARLLAAQSYLPEGGARAIRQNIQNLIEHHIAHVVLSQPCDTITIDVEHDSLTFR